MYEYEVMNKQTNERFFIWGYNWKDACRRAKVDGDTLVCLFHEYVD